MANRRSLSAALDLSPEQQAFIDGSAATAIVAEPSPLEPVESTQPNATEPRPAASQLPQKIAANSAQLLERRSVSASSTRTRKRTEKLFPDDDSIIWIPQMLVPLTTRLQPATAAALKRAGLEQKLRGQKPGTVQEISEAALQQWLRTSGYLE